MNFRTGILALLAVLGASACNIDADGDGSYAQFDCDDTNDAIYPESDELCDGLDNDCNGLVDDDTVDAPEFFLDFDRDGFGDEAAPTTDCSFDEEAGVPDPDYEPFGYVKNSDDCDDTLNTVNPEADERCDGIDNDCDGDIDEDDAIDKSTWYADADEDDFGDAAVSVEACDQPDGYVADDTDCDDSKDTMNPDEVEVCDGDDNDCDGETDEDDAADASAWYRDADEDDFGDAADSVFSCDQPTGYVADNTDCNDEAPTANPNGIETCDGLDNDCDTSTSEAGTVSLNAAADYTSIQAAVDAAAEGDTVYVCEGTWIEDVTATIPIAMVGTGADLVTVEGTGTGPVLNLQPVSSSAAYRVDGLTVRGGNNPNGGGGISAITAGGLEVADCVVEENTGSQGGGIAGPESGDTSIVDTLVQDNEASGFIGEGFDSIGGGVFLTDGEVLDSRILNNTAGFGGGIVVFDGATAASLEGTRIISNYASDGGGGIVVWPGATATGGEILNNLSDANGGGAYLGGNIEDMELAGNRAGDSGGGVFAGSTGLSIDNCVIDDNQARDGGGLGAAYGFSMDGTEITNNEASSTGGGGWSSGVDVTMDACVIEGNTAVAGGGWHLVSGTLDVVTSDWGTGTEENDPDDIYAAESDTSYTAFGSGETFFCDTDGDCS